MPTNRFQFSDDFVLKNGKVGINTTEPQEKLEVIGTIIADNITASGTSNLHTYEGFLVADYNIDQDIILSSNITSSLSDEIIVGDEATVTIGEEATSSQGNIDSLKVYNTFTVPSGGTEDRPRKVKPGQLYYNKDFKTIEFFDGNVWRQVNNTTRSGRGVFGGGLNGSSPAISTIDFINLSSGGSSSSFGVLTTNRRFCGSCSSSIRGIFGGGVISPVNDNTIDHITIASSGNAIDFGDLSVSRGTTAASSSTRGLFFGGGNTASNVIDYIHINTLGNALDFGDMILASDRSTSCSSPTRAINAGGTSTGLNTIEFVTISSTGNSVFFGNLTQKMGSMAGCSNAVRGIFAGGYNTPVLFGNNTIEYITIASAGNSQDFGDLTLLTKGAASCSTSIRAIFAGGYNPTTSSYPTKIDFVNIASKGNAQTFGDLTLGRQQFGGCSDSHGGLGGF